MGIEIGSTLDFEVKHLSSSSIVNEEHGEFISRFRNCEFISGVQDSYYHVARVDSALGAAFKVEVLFGLASQLQFEGNGGSREGG